MIFDEPHTNFLFINIESQEMFRNCNNIVLTDTNSPGNLANSNTFFYDRAQIPEGKYKVSYTFQGGRAALNDANLIPLGYGPGLVVCDLGAYTVTPTSSQNQSLSNVIGGIYPNLYGDSAYYQARQSDNVHFYLNSRPRNNNFTVSFYLAFNNVLTNSLFIAGWTLIFQFELLE
jgi:hypothetical protein